MSKLKLDKIKLQDLSKEEKRNIVGGEEEAGIGPSALTRILIKTVIKTTIPTNMECQTQNLTCTPGHQDSCGLCTTNYACPKPQ